MIRNYNFINIIKKRCLVLHSKTCFQAMFYDTFHAYKMSEVGEAESPRTAAEAKIEMGLNKKQKAPVLLQRLRKRKMRG